jgi:glycosyltransferase involved in cell wall biosynthesis
MRILFLCEGTTVPASRFRVVQFLSHFEARGIQSVVRFAYGDGYNEIASTRVGPLYKALMRTRRLVFAADADEFDIVFLQRPALPQSAVGEELAHAINPHTIFDFDDSLWMLGDGTTSTRRREGFDKTAELVSHLIAGNAFLASEAGQPQKTTIIPTVIDTVKYLPIERAKQPVTIGWMGTAGNFPFLDRLVPSLKAVLAARSDIRVRLVSNADFLPLSGVPGVEQIRWTASDEIALLQSFDIGLMPLVDSPLTRGKCAFKMIQYMAVGAPVIISNVGANREVFGSAEPGFLLDTFDWTDALLTLIDDPDLRASMGSRGRLRAESSYSIISVLPKYLEIFERVAGRR